MHDTFCLRYHISAPYTLKHGSPCHALLAMSYGIMQVQYRTVIDTMQVQFRTVIGTMQVQLCKVSGTMQVQRCMGRERLGCSALLRLCLPAGAAVPPRDPSRPPGSAQSGMPSPGNLENTCLAMKHNVEAAAPLQLRKGGGQPGGSGYV